VKKGEIFVIVGGSGCGKTTLLKHMIGLLRPMKGDVKIFGKSIVNASWDEKRKIMRHFGVLYQTGALFGSLTLAENIALPLEEFSGLPLNKIMERVNEKLKLVDLDGFQKFMPFELSGGMRKRAGFARALALDPEILFFDEPSTSLDPITSAHLDELIMNVRNKLRTTMIIERMNWTVFSPSQTGSSCLTKEARDFSPRAVPTG
jgi:phospholipid/cholesterol/gamma-HCH transport system ATP-binding protein